MPEADDGARGKGRSTGEKVLWHHRLEILVHLELTDLAVHAPYLNPGFSRANAHQDSQNQPHHFPAVRPWVSSRGIENEDSQGAVR